MIVRKNGKLVVIDVNSFHNEKVKYTTLWREKYNVKIKNSHSITAESMTDYLNGKKFSL